MVTTYIKITIKFCSNRAQIFSNCVSVDERVDDECGEADALDSARAAELFTTERNAYGDRTLDCQQTDHESGQMAQVVAEKQKYAADDSVHSSQCEADIDFQPKVKQVDRQDGLVNEEHGGEDEVGGRRTEALAA